MDKFTSKSFNPVQALANTKLEISDGEEHENLHVFRAKVHDKNLKAMSSEIEGVSGPGGIPLAKVSQQRLNQGRQFHEDQGLIPGRKGKRLRNVLLRMEEVKGPLEVLRRCRDTNTRVKVYTRNHSTVRGILTGYVVAFDKYWNLVLRDVDEVFQKKIKCMTVSLGDVEKYLNVADLSIKSDEEESGCQKDISCVWPNPFRRVPAQEKGVKHVKEATGTDVARRFDEPQCSSYSQSGSLVDYETHFSTTRAKSSRERSRHTSTTGNKMVVEEVRRNKSRERRSTEGLRIDRKTLKKNSSRLKDVTTLQVSRRGRRRDESEEKRARNREEREEKEKGEIERKAQKKRKEEEEEEERRRSRERTEVERELRKITSERERLIRELKELDEESDAEEMEEEDKDEGEMKENKKKRKRMRKKYEIRERHVSQLLIRGENVVLINVLQV